MLPPPLIDILPGPVHASLAAGTVPFTAAERAACGDRPSRLCLQVLHVTGSSTVAHVAGVLSTPIEIILILLVAFAVRLVLARLIARLVVRISRSGRSVDGRSVDGRSVDGRSVDGRSVRRRVPRRAREALRDALPLTSERRLQRAETIGSVLRSVTAVFAYGIAFVEILGLLGVNLAPIVASASVVGVAVGFGAQTLVRDFLSGMFMILEDQYGVGDVIDAGPASGSVEAVGLRVTRIRDVNGAVWHIRNGTIQRIGNMSQGWARAVLDVPVDYTVPVPRMLDLIKSVADSVWHDAQFTGLILEEPEMWGIDRFEADHLILRLAVKTRPLKQWDVARELRLRLKSRLDQEGIDVPLPQSRVWLREADRPPRPDRMVEPDEAGAGAMR